MNKTKWKAIGIRAGRSFVQGLIILLGLEGAAEMGTPIWELNWLVAIGGSLTYALLSMLTSLVFGIPEGGKEEGVDE